MEMEEEAKSAPWYQKPLYWAYKWSSDYGFSVLYPFIVWVGLLGIFTAIYWFININDSRLDLSNDLSLIESLKTSLIRSLPGIGLDRMEYIDVGMGTQGNSVSLIDTLSIWEVIAIAIHKILSLALFFLIGLALRNRFKIK